ncbi:hypothetical protein [Polyangium spumosum]|nr:hypothetical protein [Polyangium spumosum]
MKRWIQSNLAFSFRRFGVASLAAMTFAACSPVERQFEPTGAGGSGGGGGAGGGGGGMVCTPDEQRSCYTGPPGTEDVGLCKKGTQVCLPNGSGFGECGGETLPQPENCLTPEDEACNGDDGDQCLALDIGWLKSYGETLTAQLINDVVIAPDGNIVIAGSFAGMIDLGAGPLASTGGYDVLLAKITPLGEVVWAKRFGDADTQQAYAVASDAMGNIYVGGRVFGSVDFGNGVLTSAGSDDAFVAKFDTNGDPMWSKLFGDASTQQVRAIEVTKANQVILAGTFTGTVNFGGTTFTSAGGTDSFVAKLDETGFHAGSRRFGGQGFDEVRAIALGEMGQVYMTGIFDSTLDIIANQPLASKGLRDVFAAQLSPTLSPVWANAWGDSSAQEAFDIDLSPTGELLLAGAFEGKVDFGGQVVATADASTRALYVVRLASSGDVVLSAKSFGDATAFVTQAHLAVDASDQLVVVGTYTGGIDFGGGLLTNVESADLYFAKFAADGGHVASRVLQSEAGKGIDATNTMLALALLPTGDVIVAGQHRAPFLIDDALLGAFDAKHGNAFLGRFLP